MVILGTYEPWQCGQWNTTPTWKWRYGTLNPLSQSLQMTGTSQPIGSNSSAGFFASTVSCGFAVGAGAEAASGGGVAGDAAIRAASPATAAAAFAAGAFGAAAPALPVCACCCRDAAAAGSDG